MYYLLNDDATIESILSGSFLGTPDGHCIYLRYPLSGFLSLLYRMLPSVSWYSLMLLGCYLFTGIVIGKLFVQCWHKQGKRALGCIAFVATLSLYLFLPEFIKLHYTVCAAVLAGGAILITMTGQRIWISSLALLFVYCIRKDVFLLALPFWLVAILWKLQKREWKRLLQMIVIFLGASVVFVGLNAFFYRSDVWKEYEKYNDSRTKVYDYSWYRQYEEIEDTYQEYGITYEQYQMLDNYALSLDGDLDASFFDNVYAATTQGDWVDTPLHTVKRMMVQYRNWIFRNPEEPFSLTAIALYCILLVFLCLERNFYHAGVLVALGLGRSVIWMYLFWRRRFPERVEMSLFILEFMILLGAYLEVFSQKKRERLRYQIVLFGISLGFLCGAVYLTGDSLQKQIEQEHRQQEFQVLQEYFEAHPNQSFLLDVRSVSGYSERIFESGQKQKNYFLAGGWLSGSPLLARRYAQLGVKDGADALLHLDTVRYVIAADSSFDWLENYLGEPAKQVEQIGEFKILSWH